MFNRISTVDSDFFFDSFVSLILFRSNQIDSTSQRSNFLLLRFVDAAINLKSEFANATCVGTKDSLSCSRRESPSRDVGVQLPFPFPSSRVFPRFGHLL